MEQTVNKWKKAGVVCISIAAVLALFLSLLITGIQLATYADPGFFERKFDKYEIPEALHMEEEEALRVADDMMDYLIGSREELQTKAIVDGEEVMFFNEREIAHMEDVKKLFQGALQIRFFCVIGLILFAVFLVWNRAFRKLAGRTYQIMTGALAAITAVAVIAVSQVDFLDFWFFLHPFFFSNDFWILDSRTDRLIVMLPTGFFLNTVIACLSLFLIGIVLVLALSFVLTGWGSRKNESQG